MSPEDIALFRSVLAGHEEPETAEIGRPYDSSPDRSQVMGGT